MSDELTPEQHQARYLELLLEREREEAQARTIAEEHFGPCRTEPWSALHVISGDIQLAIYDDPLGAGWTRIPDGRYAWRRFTGVEARGLERPLLIVKPPVEPRLFGQ